MLALALDAAVVLGRVRLALGLRLLLERLVLLHAEDLLVHRAAIVKQLLAEVAELESVWACLPALRLKVDLHDRRAQPAVELRVSVLDLRLTEDGLHDDLEDLLADLEAFSLSCIEAFLVEQLAITDQHFTKLGHFAVKVVRSDLIQLQTHLLHIVLVLLDQSRITLGIAD